MAIACTRADVALTQVGKQIWPQGSSPLLTIVCMTYNHEWFLEDCLAGFLKQETSFPVQIVIHDDASSDRTPEIIREHKERHPQLIETILQSANMYSEGCRPGVFIKPLIKGKYVALCEGDDYWTDPQKLEKQVRFLEDNPDYVLSFHDAKVINEQGQFIKGSKMPVAAKRDVSSEQLIKVATFILNLSLVYRNVALPTAPEARFILNGDNFNTSRLGWYGKGKYHADIQPAVYRVHPGGVWSCISESKKKTAKMTSFLWMSHYYARVGEKRIARHFKAKALIEMFRYIGLERRWAWPFLVSPAIVERIGAVVRARLYRGRDL